MTSQASYEFVNEQFVFSRLKYSEKWPKPSNLSNIVVLSVPVKLVKFSDI